MWLKRKAPNTLVLHGRAGNCVGDMASYDYFTLGGPYSVRGYSPGELGACRWVQHMHSCHLSGQCAVPGCVQLLLLALHETARDTQQCSGAGVRAVGGCCMWACRCAKAGASLCMPTAGVVGKGLRVFGTSRLNAVLCRAVLCTLQAVCGGSSRGAPANEELV